MNARVMKVILRDKDIEIEEIKKMLNLNDEETIEYLLNFLENEIETFYEIQELDNKFFFYTVKKIEDLQGKLLKEGKSKMIYSERLNNIRLTLYKLMNKNKYTSNKKQINTENCIAYLNDKDDIEFYNVFAELAHLYRQDIPHRHRYRVIIENILKLIENDPKRLSLTSKIFLRELKYGSYTEIPKKTKVDLYSYINTKDKFIFTIDPDNINLREDAISVDRNGDDILVTIYITDPTDYYINDTNVKNEIFNKWFIENRKVIIDKQYAKENLSLDENKKRNVIAYELTFDNNYSIKNINIYEDVIEVDKNYTYEEFNELRKDDDIYTLIEITTKLNEENKYKTEYHLLKEINDKIRKLQDKEIKYGNAIVEELKILVNKIVSNMFYENDLPCIYRNNKFCIKDETGYYELKKCEQYDRDTITIIKDKKVELESYYSNICEGHFGLNLESYMHTTTPLRNYFALINTLILRDVIINGNFDKREEYQNLVSRLVQLQEEKIQKKNKKYKKILVK